MHAVFGQLTHRPRRHPSSLSICALCGADLTFVQVYQLQYDSAHGRYPGTLSCDKENLIVDGRKIRVFTE